ncbi:MAG TPA: SWIM zinc finger family protein, partial [Acidimicrobiales bacterium]|nr:SWIM zinc finger family protein [Acidimicrobiales bacterium]
VPGRDRREELGERLSLEQIEKLAGNSTLDRAMSYQEQGRVEAVHRTGSTVTALVRGTVPYRVKLDLRAPPEWSCNCPVGVEGKFCKHCAALAIELLDAGDGESRGEKAGHESSLVDPVRELTREQLEEIVMSAAGRDPRVARAVEIAVATAAGRPLDGEGLGEADRCGISDRRVRSIRQGT